MEHDGVGPNDETTTTDTTTGIPTPEIEPTDANLDTKDTNLDTSFMAEEESEEGFLDVKKKSSSFPLDASMEDPVPPNTEQGIEENYTVINQDLSDHDHHHNDSETPQHDDGPREKSEVVERDIDLGLQETEAREMGQLPEEYVRRLVSLQCESSAAGGVCDVHLVGTAHVSLESCKEVQAVIRCLRPEVVFLELCSSRIGLLSPQNLEVPTLSEMLDMWRKQHMNAFGVLYSWFLAKVAQKLEVFPGSEFRVAYEEAIQYGAKVILGDRPVQITLRRTWGKMSLWHKTKFLFCMFFQAILLPSPEELDKMMREMKDVDAITLVIQEMSKSFPTLIETLLHERDMYLSSSLLKVASEHTSVVAVVGRGHLSGIENNWGRPVSVESLMEVPVAKSRTSTIKILTAMSLAIGSIAITTGLFLTRKK